MDHRILPHRFFFVYPSWIYHVQLTVDLSCAKRQIILMWHSCPRRCDLLCRFSWPTGAFPDHGPGRKAWVLHQRQSAHLGRWWWSGPPLSIDLGAGRYRHFESMAVCHRRSMQWYDASFWIWRKVVELYNCEILQNTWNLWQIGRLVGQDYGSGEEDWCLIRWEA